MERCRQQDGASASDQEPGFRPDRRHFLASTALLLAGCGGGQGNFQGAVPAVRATPIPQIPTVLSEADLRGYLARSIAMHYWSGEVPYQTGDAHTQHLDNLRMVQNVGAKHVQHVAFIWWDLNTTMDIENHFSTAQRVVADIHAQDATIIVGAGCFETAGPGMNVVPVPEWVFAEFSLPVVTRTFDWKQMLYPDQRVSDGNPSTLAIDITKLEARMWFYYMTRRYIDCGFEDIHLGEVATLTQNDIPTYANYWDLVNRIRAYAAQNARRKFFLINAQTYPANQAGIWDEANGVHGIADAAGNLALDYIYHGTRAKENPDSPQDCVLAGYRDTIYGKTRGGRAPQGWICERQLYSLQLDPGASPNAGVPIGYPYQWGWSEPDWLVNQPRTYRADWLRYAVAWLGVEDTYGFFAPLGMSDGGLIPGITYYHANNPWYGTLGDPNLPERSTDPRDQWFKGFGDEPVIKELFDGTADPVILNGDFHRPVLTGTTVDWIAPEVPSWTFSGTAGVARSGSTYVGSQSLASGAQVGVLAGTGSISQAILAPGGRNYLLQISAAQRTGPRGTDGQSIVVSVDGMPVWQFAPSDSFVETTIVCPPLQRGAHLITIAGSSAGTDVALLANVQIAAATIDHAAVEQLMAFAEQQYPDLFPAGPSTQSYTPFLYRHYPTTGIYLGVVVADGSYTSAGVYVMGGAFGSVPRSVGVLADFVKTGP
jgi:hypothetical protein